MKNRLFLIFCLCSFIENTFASGEVNELVPYEDHAQCAFLQERADTDSFPVSFQFRDFEDREFLRYIAASHVSGRPEDGDDHPTYEMITQAFEEFQPDVVILEGFPPEDIERVTLICQNRQGEHMYAARLSIDRSIPFKGGEPQVEKILKALQDFSYNATDYVCLKLIDRIAQEWREKNPMIREGKLEDFINEKASLYASIQPDFTFLDFLNWSQKHYGRTLTLTELIDTEFAAPIIEGHYLQKISVFEDEIRNREIIGHIINACETFDRVLVVYGGSHFYCQHKILEDRFGSSTAVTP